MAQQRTKRIVLAVLTAVLAFAGLGAWAIASPVGASPDEDFHLASIWCAWGDRDQLCESGASPEERVVSERLVESSGCFAQNPRQSAQCALDDAQMVETTRGNFMGAYPPVFYSVMGVLASPDVAVSTVIMRLVNAGIFVGAVASVLALLRPGQRGPIVWSATVALVPLGVFTIVSVNPSSWAILAGLLVWMSAYGYFIAETRTRRIALGAIAVVLGVMGAGARGDSAVYVSFAALVAAILTFRKSKVWAKFALLPAGIIATGAAFFLSAQQSAGLAAEGLSQGSAIASESAAASGGSVASSALTSLIANFINLPWLWTGGTGTWGLGWMDTAMPDPVWVIMIGALFALVFWGLRQMDLRKSVVLIIALGALTVIPLYVLYSMGAEVGDWVQPRYILPLLLIFVSVALYGFAKDHLGMSRLQAGIIFAVIAASNSLALHNNMRRYISGLGDAGFNLNANIEWWWNIPFPPMIVWFAGSAAFALMLVGLWLWLYPRGERPSASVEERSPDLIGR